MAQIYAFGDSITYGAWDIRQGGWVTLLRNYIDTRMSEDPNFYGLVYNLGIPGETTEGLVKRLENEIIARLRNGEEYVFLFAYGANDATFIPSRSEFRVDIQSFIKNYEKVLTIAKKYGTKIMLLSITPVIDEVTFNLATKDRSRLNKECIEPYNVRLKKFAEENQIPFVDVYSAFMAKDYKQLFDKDGLHPNEKGHELIFKAVKSTLDSMVSY